MTADIDLWVTATILRELRNNGLITQKEAEKSFPASQDRLARRLLFPFSQSQIKGILHSAGTHKGPNAEYRHCLSKVSLKFC